MKTQKDKWVWCAGHEQMRKLLIEKCNAALIKPEFRRKGNTTWCNQAAFWIAKEIGADTQCFFAWDNRLKMYIVTNADTIYDNCVRLCRDDIVQEIDINRAAELAWKGIAVLAAAHTHGVKGFRRSGHVSIVYPTVQEKELQVANIGWNNLICSPSAPDSFGGADYLTPIKYFHIHFPSELV